MIPNCTRCGKPEKLLFSSTYCDCQDNKIQNMSEDAVKFAAQRAGINYGTFVRLDTGMLDLEVKTALLDDGEGCAAYKHTFTPESEDTWPLYCRIHEIYGDTIKQKIDAGCTITMSVIRRMCGSAGTIDPLVQYGSVCLKVKWSKS